MKLISIVVPCFNEEDVIEISNERIIQITQAITDYDFEIIYVNDGSRDTTLNLLKNIRNKFSNVRIISLSRNFGHQKAITAGIKNAQGDAVVVIDADLQDPPELINDMIRKWEKGFDVVYGKRMKRRKESAFKLMTAKFFYRFINYLSEVKIPLDTGDFRLIDRKVVDAFNEMNEQYRFIRGMISWMGFNQTYVLYDRDERMAGETKYPLKKMMKLAFDAIFSFSVVPLKIATFIGIFASVVAVLGILYALALRLFTDIYVVGFTATFTAVLFIGGIQLITLGIIGEYIGRVYGESKKRPLYLISEKIGFDLKVNATEDIY